MSSQTVVLLVSILLCSSMVSVFCQDKPDVKKVGDPIFSLQAAGAGNNAKNFAGGFQAGVGTKVWEKKDKSLELGVGYGQNFARVDGHTYKSKPMYGLGGTFRWGKK